MRVAIVSDIHGNVLALEAVLQEIKIASPDHLICLGDVGADGPEPSKVIAHLRDLNCPVVMGNMDDQLLNPFPPFIIQTDDPLLKFRAIWSWGTGQLSTDDVLFMRSFQPTIQIELDKHVTMLCYHGSPRSHKDAIRVISPDAELDAYFEGQPDRIFVGGYTHQPFLRRYRNCWLMNPGSVGLPFEWSTSLSKPVNRASAEYALLTWQKGQLSVDFRAIDFDLLAFSQRVRAAGMPYADWFLSHWQIP